MDIKSVCVEKQNGQIWGGGALRDAKYIGTPSS